MGFGVYSSGRSFVPGPPAYIPTPPPPTTPHGAFAPLPLHWATLPRVYGCLVASTGRRRVKSLFDSGASHCFLSPKLAAQLPLSRRRPARVGHPSQVQQGGRIGARGGRRGGGHAVGAPPTATELPDATGIYKQPWRTELQELWKRTPEARTRVASWPCIGTWPLVNFYCSDSTAVR